MLPLATVPLIAALLSAPPPSAGGAAVEAAGPARTDRPSGALSALVDVPELHLGVSVRAIGVVKEPLAQWRPLLTRFDPSAYVATRLWSDEQRPWLEAEYRSPACTVFARRGSHAAAVLAGAGTHDRLELELAVREIQAGHAWIEVLSARWTEQQTPEGTVLHAIRALELAEREAWTLAENELDRALRPDLPSPVRRELEEIRDECRAARAAAAGR